MFDNMLSDERFQQLQSEYFEESATYDDSNPNYEDVKLLLIAISEVESVHEELKERHGDERHWAQQQLITRSIDDLLSAFLLTKNYFYSSAYRDIRGLFETYLLLNYMNDHKIETAMAHWKQERDLLEMNLSEEEMQQLTWEELHIEDEYHRMRREEKNRLEDKDEDFKRLYNFFSNRHVHPARFDGIDLQRTFVEEEERQLIDWQLDITLGLIYQLVKLYSDTEDLRYILEELSPIGEEIEESHSPQSFVYIAEDNFPMGEEND